MEICNMFREDIEMANSMNPNERKEEAEAQQAESAANKAKEELEDWRSPLAKQAREAARRQAIAEADKAVSDAQRAQISALVPDFSMIEKGETTVKGEQAVFGNLLVQKAMEKAAAKVSAKVAEKFINHGNKSVLITTEADLASTDAIYLEVVTGLDTFIEDANKLLTPSEDELDSSNYESLDAGPLLGSIASAVPGLLSLFSTNRTLSSFTTTVDTKAAVAGVASTLVADHSIKVQLDDFRTTSLGGSVVNKEKELKDARINLIKHKLDIEIGLTQADKDQNVALDQISDLIKRIDAFIISLHTIPSGGKRSPFGIAILRQHLHVSENGNIEFPMILFIEASAGTVDQLINNKPLLFNDNFHLIGSVAITYWLMDTKTSNVMASGVESDIYELYGKIGKRLVPESNSTRRNRFRGR